MQFRFWTRMKHGEFKVGITSVDQGRMLARVLTSFCWHLDMHKHKDFKPSYVIETMDEDGESKVLEEKTMEPLPPWSKKH